MERLCSGKSQRMRCKADEASGRMCPRPAQGRPSYRILPGRMDSPAGCVRGGRGNVRAPGRATAGASRTRDRQGGAGTSGCAAAKLAASGQSRKLLRRQKRRGLPGAAARPPIARFSGAKSAVCVRRLGVKLRNRKCGPQRKRP